MKKSLIAILACAALAAAAAFSFPATAAPAHSPGLVVATTHAGVTAGDAGFNTAVDKESASMTMRAKFKVSSITQQAHWNKPGASLYTLQLQPVTSGSEENKSFYEATPSGQIQIGVVSEEIGKRFPIGAEVYVDFTLAAAAPSSS